MTATLPLPKKKHQSEEFFFRNVEKYCMFIRSKSSNVRNSNLEQHTYIFKSRFW